MAFRPCSHKYFGYVCLATFKMTYQSALVFMFALDVSALLTEPDSTHPDNIYLHRRRQGSTLNFSGCGMPVAQRIFLARSKVPTEV